MKVIAMYLPQFHRVKENDEWWGEGYTEWTSVKNSKALYDGHNQPRKPLDDNYYDLMEKSTLQQQEKLMKEYGIDGLAFYHYYFKEGRKILEKPAENLLGWKDIDIPFCFSWDANSWIRSWSNVQGNVWNLLQGNQKTEGHSAGVLIEQDFGGETQWKDHFYYLLPFFKDDRYIKKDNCPVMIFFSTDIPCLKEMKETWNKLAKEEGFERIYFIGRNVANNNFDSLMLQEPHFTTDNFREHYEINDSGIKVLDYDVVCENQLKQYETLNKYTNLGAFVGYDDTPRRGSEGRVIIGGSPEKFEHYLIRLFHKAHQLESDFVFINAWNEWGEGMYLEPDSDVGYGYLEAVRNAKHIFNTYVDVFDAISISSIKNDNSSDTVLQKICDRYRSYWTTMYKWMDFKLADGSVEQRLLDDGCKKIGIYGIGMIGKLLIRDLSSSNVEVCFGIDEKGQYYDGDIKIYKLNEQIPEVDVIINTVVYDNGKIKKALEQKNFKVIQLEELF